MKHMNEFQLHIGIKMRFYPSCSQKRISARNMGTSLFVYNRMVALNNERYELRKYAWCSPVYRNRLDYLDTVLSSLEEFQNTIPFLNDKDIDAQCIANARQNYHKAWDNFKKNPASGVPVFHKKKYHTSYQTNPHYYKKGGCNVYFTDRHHIMIPKLGRCRINGSPKIMEKLFPMINDIRFGTITVSCDACGRYFISIQIASDRPLHDTLPSTGSMRGYDMNLENYYTDSDGNVVDNPRYKRNIQDKLSKLQCKLSRRAERAKREGRSLRDSHNYQKLRKKVAYLQDKISSRREDFQHVLSRHEVESQDYMFVEDLKTKNLMKNHKLAYAISDAAWSSFHHMLEYKASMYGKTFLKIPASLTSQTCSDCGYVLPKDQRLKLSDREWVCPDCGSYHNRDHNAAKVVLFRGMAALGM